MVAPDCCCSLWRMCSSARAVCVRTCVGSPSPLLSFCCSRASAASARFVCSDFVAISPSQYHSIARKRLPVLLSRRLADKPLHARDLRKHFYSLLFSCVLSFSALISLLVSSSDSLFAESLCVFPQNQPTGCVAQVCRLKIVILQVCQKF